MPYYSGSTKIVQNTILPVSKAELKRIIIPYINCSSLYKVVICWQCIQVLSLMLRGKSFLQSVKILGGHAQGRNATNIRNRLISDNFISLSDHRRYYMTPLGKQFYRAWTKKFYAYAKSLQSDELMELLIDSIKTSNNSKLAA